MSEQLKTELESLAREMCVAAAEIFMLQGWIEPGLMMGVRGERTLVLIPPEALVSDEVKDVLFSVLRQLLAEANAEWAVFICESECKLPDGTSLEFAMANAQSRIAPEISLVCIQPVRRIGDQIVLDGEAVVSPSMPGRMNLFATGGMRRADNAA